MLKVLVIDDEAVVRRGIVLGVDWAKIGCAVVGEAENGEEGLALAEQCRPNLIITDIRMPRMDGIAMLTALRARGCDAHVIVLTAYSDFAYARDALKLKADDYLLKPFRNQELESTVAKILQKAQAGDMPVPEAVPSPESAGKSKYVMEAMNYIAGHYGDSDIGITAVAEHLMVSEGYLSHVFKKETNYTVTGYLTQYRIHMAMRLLKDCRLKVYEVAQRVGYRDVTYFGSIFKKLSGMSPSEYQDRCGG